MEQIWSIIYSDSVIYVPVFLTAMKCLKLIFMLEVEHYFRVRTTVAPIYDGFINLVLHFLQTIQFYV